MRKLLLAMMALLVFFTATAQDDLLLKFEPIDDQYASVAAQNEDISGDIVIPSTVNIDGKEYYVTTVAEEGFKDTKITSIVLPLTMRVIDYYAFLRCRSLISIALPPGIEEIRFGAFVDCPNLESIQVEYDEWHSRFHNVGKAVVDYSNYIVIYPNKGESELIIPEVIKGIRYGAFYYSLFPKEIYIPSSVENVEQIAFAGIPTLKRVLWNASTSNIPPLCFADCMFLTEVAISETVCDIGYWAFRNAPLNTIIVLNRTPPTFVMDDKSNTFDNLVFDNATVYVPAGCLETYHTAEGWSKFSHIEEIQGCGWQRTLIVATHNGEQLEYLLDKDTKVNISLPNLIIETNGSQLIYNIDNLSQIRYGHKYVATGIHGEIIVNGQSFRMEDGALLFDNLRDNSLIEICTVDGKVVMSHRYSGYAYVSLRQLKSGLYIVKLNGETYKFLKK